jgi:NAD(P)H dehydrogenase (quinone)
MKKIIILIFIVIVVPLILQAKDTVVLIAYYSAQGHTKAMARAVADGVSSTDGVVVKLQTIQETKTEDILEADAIIVGTPVYNANVAPQVQKFINSWPFKDAPLKDKIGAAFTTAGGISAGEESVMLSILRSMLIYNMIIVGGPDWQSAFGASAIVDEAPFDQIGKETKVSEQFLEKGRALGERVALLVKEIKPVEHKNRSSNE